MISTIIAIICFCVGVVCIGAVLFLNLALIPIGILGIILGFLAERLCAIIKLHIKKSTQDRRKNRTIVNAEVSENIIVK